MAEDTPSASSLLGADNLLEILFERTPVGIALFDRDLVLERCNPTWAAFVTKYARLPVAPAVVAGAPFFDLAPGNEAALMPLIQRVLCGEVVRRDALRLVVGGRESYWDLALVPLIQGGQVIGILDVSVDATERVEASHEIARQNAYLAALHEMGLGIIGRLDVSELLQAIVERAQALVESLYGWLYLVAPEGDGIEVRVGTGPFHRYVGLCLQPGEGLAGAVWQHGQPIIVDDYQAWPGRAPLFGADPIGPAIGVPLKNGPEVVGVIGLTRAPGQPPFTAGELHLMGRFAQLASIALENARLHASLQEQLAESQQETARRAEAEEALRRSQAELRAIFSAMTDVILVLDRDGRYVEVAPTDPALLYRPAAELVGNRLHDLFPADQAEFFLTQIRRVSESREPVNFEYSLSIHGREVWFSATVAPLNGDSVMWVARDITHDKRNEEVLQHRIDERTHELAALNAIAGAVSRSLDLESILCDALDKTMQLMGMELGLACRLARAEGGAEAGEQRRLVPLAHRGISDALAAVANPMPLRWTHLHAGDDHEPVVWKVADHPVPLYREALERERVRLGVSVPLVSKGALLGAIFLATGRERAVTADEMSLLRAVGNQVAVAIENARLYQAALDRQAEAERRRQVAEGMREILASLNSDQPLPQILNDIVARASRLLGTDAGIIRRTGAGRGTTVGDASYHVPPELAGDRLFPDLPSSGDSTAASRRPLVIADCQAESGERMSELDSGGPEQYRLVTGNFAAHFRSALRVPLVARDQEYGELALFCRGQRDFSEEDVSVALAIADQTALAIENALLRQQAAEAAAITERARLARELHDSVTQSIYSVTLYAEAAARLLATGEGTQAAAYLCDLRDTSQEALREMRLLVWELRPPALEQIGLAGALQARLRAVEARGGLATEFRAEGPGPEPWLSLEDQQELYTIGQEALNNVLRHAHARRVSITLKYTEESACLIVGDDGAGFDPAAARNCGGMGLAGMAERADRIRSRLSIQSCQGAGTAVTVEVPRDRPGFAGAGDAG